MSNLVDADVVLISRIYLPEPAAASFRLGALARGLRDVGARVTVLTTRPPNEYSSEIDDPEGVKVRRAPVLRDRMGYVRGYLQYLSFDVPMAFRLLFRPRPQLVIVEPPPTSGVVVRIVCALRRVPYVYYAADVWSDAVLETTAPRSVARVVRACEIWAINGAAAVLSVSEGFAERLQELGVTATISTIGNGVDTTVFKQEGERRQTGRPYLLYAGTASEVHGAGLFVPAFERVLKHVPDAQLVFIGQGSERDAIERASKELPPGSVIFEPRLSPTVVAEWIRGASATLASVKPGDYHRAFPTKMYASIACGTRVIYAGLGPGRIFAASNNLGWVADYSAESMAEAMREALGAPDSVAGRTAVAEWAVANVSLAAVASRAAVTVAPVVRAGAR